MSDELVVLDTSALLAVLDEEPGVEVVLPLLSRAAVSTVILAEVYTVLAARDDNPLKGFDEIQFALGRIVPFSLVQAEVAGKLRRPTRRAGLSLGDRACLSLALELAAPVYTADRIWATLDLPCEVRLIR